MRKEYSKRVPHLILHCSLSKAKRFRPDAPLQRMRAKCAKCDSQTTEHCPNSDEPPVC